MIGLSAWADEPYTEFEYNGIVVIDGLKFAVTLPEDGKGEALLMGVDDTYSEARAATRGIIAVQNLLEAYIEFKEKQVKRVTGDAFIMPPPYGIFLRARGLSVDADNMPSLQRTATVDPDKEYTCELKVIGYSALQNNTDITELIIPETVTTIWGSAFDGCSNLQKVTLPSKLLFIGFRAFAYCNSLTEINIPNSVSEIQPGAFMNCKGLKKVSLPSGLTEISKYLFHHCENLQSVTGGENATKIGNNAFECCYKLTDYTLPSALDSICDRAFLYCQQLKSITIPRTLRGFGVEAFCGCTRLQSVTFESGSALKEINESVFTTTSLTSVSIPNSVGRIGYQAFAYSDLTEVALPAQLTEIGDSAFHFTKLTAVTIPAAVKKICTGAFNDCGELANLTFESGSQLQTIGNNAFTATAITELTVPDGVMSIGESAFLVCQNLESLTLSKQLTSMGDEAFMECYALKSVTAPMASPFSIERYVFSSTTYSNATLYVPRGTKTLYHATDCWSRFLNIVEEEDDGQSEEITKDLYSIGKSDFSSGWWTSFSKTYLIPDGDKLIMDFNLHIDPNSDVYYKNFALILTNDEDLGSSNYREYGAIRFDYTGSHAYNSEWGNIDRQYINSTLQLYPDYNDCDPNVHKLGGKVKLIVDRSKNDAFYVEISNGMVTKTYSQPYVMPNLNVDANNKNIRCFLVVEKSYIDFLGSNIEPVEGFGNSDAKESYVVYDNGTLTFYCDNQRSNRASTTYDLNEGRNRPAWETVAGGITKAVFDATFAEARPTTTLYWFCQCHNLVEIEGIDNLNTSNVTSMENMFYECNSLTSLDVSKFETSNVTNMSGMFSYCSSLTSLDVSKFNTSNVINMKQMFWCCSSIACLDVSEFNTTNVEDMNLMFYNCGNLVNLIMGSYFTSNETNNGSNEFYGCSKLNKITYNGDIPSSMNSKFFEGVGSAETPVTLTVPELYRTNYQAKFDGNKFYGGYFTLIGDEVSELKDGDIFTANTVEGVEMTFKVISAKDKIVQVGTGDGNTSAVDKDYAGTLTIPKEINGYKVDEIASHAFSYCNFSEIVLPSGLTYIDTEAFYLCESLKSIRIPSSLQNMSVVAFVSCTSVESIVVEEGNEYFDSREGCNAIIRKDDKTLIRGCKNSFIPSGVERINFAAFQQTPLVGSFVIPEGVTYIGQSAFVSATMSSISLPSTLTYIGGLSFQNCNGIESVAIPEGVTYIGNYAFSFCDKLNRVTIPASVTEIGEKAFIGSTQLKTIVSYLTEPCAIADNVFMVNDLDDGNNSLINATLYVPFGSKTIYENTDGWKNFKNIVELNATVGDVTGDGEVTKEDITEVETEILEPSAVFDPNKDVNRDGVVNVADIVEGNNIRNSQ